MYVGRKPHGAQVFQHQRGAALLGRLDQFGIGVNTRRLVGELLVHLDVIELTLWILVEAIKFAQREHRNLRTTQNAYMIGVQILIKGNTHVPNPRTDFL